MLQGDNVVRFLVNFLRQFFKDLLFKIKCNKIRVYQNDKYETGKKVIQHFFIFRIYTITFLYVFLLTNYVDAS